MMMEVWNSDWQQRFRMLIQRLGYDDAFTFVMSRKGESFGEMFGRLRRAAGPEEARVLALRHLEEAFYVGAYNKGKLRQAFIEALVRSLRQYLRHGWNCGKRLRERRIDARTRWPTPSFIYHSGWEFDDWRQLRERAWNEIELVGPPDEWCPADHNDPILEDIFSRVWPDSDSSTDP